MVVPAAGYRCLPGQSHSIRNETWRSHISLETPVQRFEERTTNWVLVATNRVKLFPPFEVLGKAIRCFMCLYEILDTLTRARPLCYVPKGAVFTFALPSASEFYIRLQNKAPLVVAARAML